MKHLENYEQFNEGRFFRGAAKVGVTIASGLGSLARLLTLKWDSLIFGIKSIPYSYKFINILDMLKDDKNYPSLMKDKLEFYKNKYGTDIFKDIEESKNFVANSNIKDKNDYIELLDDVKSSIDKALINDEMFSDALQDTKNKIVELSAKAKEKGYASIDYPEEWFDKPISKMDKDELRKEMDKALDNKDMAKAKYIGKHLNSKED